MATGRATRSTDRTPTSSASISATHPAVSTDVDITGVHDAYPGGNTLDGYPVQSGNQRGVGLQVDNDAPGGGDPLLEFFMHGGSISDFQKNATSFLRADLDISGVHVTGGGGQTVNAQNGFQAVASTGSISGNTIEAIGFAGASNTATGILLFSNTDLDVTGNTITGSSVPGANIVGVYVTESGGPSSGGEISGNTISHVDQGIFVGGTFAPTSISVTDNDVSHVDTTSSWAAGVDFEPDQDLDAGVHRGRQPRRRLSRGSGPGRYAVGPRRRRRADRQRWQR